VLLIEDQINYAIISCSSPTSTQFRVLGVPKRSGGRGALLNHGATPTLQLREYFARGQSRKIVLVRFFLPW
jgi:hypothetical protein